MLGGTTLSFDPSVLELFLPLMHGAQLVIADRPTMVDPGALADLAAARGRDDHAGDADDVADARRRRLGG